MTERRTASRAKTDEAAFPVRVRLDLSDEGAGMRIHDIHAWLKKEIGGMDYAHHGSSGYGINTAISVYFRTTEAAAAFVEAFPDLKLADATERREYARLAADIAAWRFEDVCNLYSMTKGQDAIRQLFDGIEDRTGNLPELLGIFPDTHAPIVRDRHGERELVLGRWGMPSPKFVLKNRSADPGVTNIRNTESPHWRRWLGVEHRCLVPFTAFSEYGAGEGGKKEPVWFAMDESRPLVFFAGLWTEWTSVRKVKDGETTDQLYGFLTCQPNEVVGEIHPKAMPVILTEPDEWEAWLTEPWEKVSELQRPLPDEWLKIVARGERRDPGRPV